MWIVQGSVQVPAAADDGVHLPAPEPHGPLSVPGHRQETPQQGLPLL